MRYHNAIAFKPSKLRVKGVRRDRRKRSGERPENKKCNLSAPRPYEAMRPRVPSFDRLDSGIDVNANLF